MNLGEDGGTQRELQELGNISEQGRAEDYNNWNEKNMLEGIRSRLDVTEELTSDLPDHCRIKISKKKKKKRI